MKKRETTSKSLKQKSNITNKKLPSKSKSQPKDTRKQDQYFIFGDTFYVASTHTERHVYREFEKQVKSRPHSLKKSAKRSNRELEPINLHEYVKSLSKAQKQQLFHDLQKEIQIEKEEGRSVVENEAEQKLGKLNIKLQNICGELMKRWEEEINKINHLFENEHISLEDKNQKIRLVEKIRNNKLAMVDHIRILFNKIMLDQEPELNRPSQIQYIINSLGSLNSFQSLCHNHEVPPISSSNSPFESEIPPITKQAQKEKQNQQREELEEYENIQRQFFHEQSPNQIKHPIQPLEIQPFNKQNLKLQIRLDEVQFWKDHYDEEPNHKDIVIEEQKHFHQQIQKNKLENPSPPPQKLGFKSLEMKSLQQEFLCRQDSAESKLKIPLLMTKDRLEQIQQEKTSKEKEMLVISMKQRSSYQVSQVMPQTEAHFTTLIDVNNFIVTFYEFIMQRCLKEVIQGLNLAYGKSSLDKLFLLRNQGLVPDIQNNVLVQHMLDMFHKQISLNVRKLSEYEKYHNRAIYNAFNIGLNVYRPYYDLEGDVFPWNTSEKGLTFYQISQDNIEQVFEKSKMKVLQYCTNLCGIMPNIQLTTAQAKKQLDKRNEQTYQRVVKAEIKQHFGDWYIKVLNFEALQRLNIYRQILEDEMDLFCYQLLRVKQRHRM